MTGLDGAERPVEGAGEPRWTFGPAHPDFGFGPKDWRPAANVTYRPRSGGPGRGGLNGRWSLAHDACRDCGKTERGHAGRGYCFGCYYKHLGEFAAASPRSPEGRGGAG